MDQICPILCDKWETEFHTNPLPFQNSIAINVKIFIENFSFFQGWATNRAIFSECDHKVIILLEISSNMTFEVRKQLQGAVWRFNNAITNQMSFQAKIFQSLTWRLKSIVRSFGFSTIFYARK